MKDTSQQSGKEAAECFGDIASSEKCQFWLACRYPPGVISYRKTVKTV